MARPIKDGVDYFPLDVDFLHDDKVRLLKVEFGVQGVTILIAILCEIYRGCGYFKRWDDDFCFLMADAVGCGVVPENIKQVALGCLRRSIFDNGVFQLFGVLTSAGIQRRFLRAVATRDEIPIIREYWLLDEDNRKDVPASVLKKLRFQTVNSKETTESLKKTPVPLQINPQRKVEESKGEKRKEAAAARVRELSEYWQGLGGTASLLVHDDLGHFLEAGIEMDAIREAMNEAALAGAVHGWRYPQRILERYEREGLHTLAQVKAQNQGRRKQDGTTDTAPAGRRLGTHV